MEETVESLTLKLSEAQAKLALSARTEADLTAARTANEAAQAAVEAAKAEAKAAREESAAKLTEAQTAAQAKLTKAALRLAAVAAGAKSADDVLALVGAGDIKLDANGELENGDALVAKLKETKPYLFGGKSSTHEQTPPPPPKSGTGQKRAKEMTDEEYRAARAELTKRR